MASRCETNRRSRAGGNPVTFNMLIAINNFRVDAGGSPAATHFSCFAKKSKQKKATRGSSPRKSAGYPSETAASVSGSAGASQWDAKPLPHLETTGRCGTRARMSSAQKILVPLALKQSSRTTPVASALLGDSHRGPGGFSPVSPRRRPGFNLNLSCATRNDSYIFGELK